MFTKHNGFANMNAAAARSAAGFVARSSLISIILDAVLLASIFVVRLVSILVNVLVRIRSLLIIPQPILYSMCP